MHRRHSHRGSRLLRVSTLGLGALVIVLALAAGAWAGRVGRSGDRPATAAKRQASAVVSARLLTPARRWVPGQVLVTLRDAATSRLSAPARAHAGLAEAMWRLGPSGHRTTVVYSLKRGWTVRRALAALRADRSVLRAQPNYISHLDVTPDDPSFANQWGLHNTGQTIGGQAGVADADIDAPETWDLQTGDLSEVTVAVIDSGIDLHHPDLEAKIWQNDDPAGGGDGDGNGFVDDAAGWNFAGVSQLNGNAAWSLGQAGSIKQVAQKIAGTGCPLTRIGFYMQRLGNPSAGITVGIRDTLLGADLASFALTPGDISTSGAYISGELSSPVTLTDGATYYIVARTIANGYGSDYYIYADNTPSGDPGAYKPNPYREGSELYWDGYSWIDTGSDDMVFITNPNAVPRDDNGHGTHVSGIVGAATDNGTGIAGASWAARIMPLKAGDCSGSLLTSDQIAAIYYAVDNGADVINMSFASSVADPARQAAVTYAHDAGVLLVAAAGNEAAAGNPVEYPAAGADVVSVGATDNRDAWASFSEHNASVDVSAPGVGIYSATPTYPVGLTSYGVAPNYAFLNGTSMASPLVAGVAALALARDPGLTPDQVTQYLQDNAADLGSGGRDDYFGYGRINAAATLADIPVALSGHFTIGDGSGYTVTREVDLHSTVLLAVDMRTSVNDGATWGVWQSYAAVTSASLAPGDGIKHLRVQYRDAGGSVLELRGWVELDTTSPAGSLAVNGGAATTSSRNVTADSAVTGAVDMRFSVNGGSSWTGWETYAAARSLTLTAGDGLKTVRGEYRDRAGNVLALTDDIILAQGPSGTFSLNSGAVATRSATVTCTSAIAGAVQMRFSTDGGTNWTGWETYAATRSITVPSGEGTKWVDAEYRDALSVVLALDDSIVLDTLPPTGTFVVNGGATATASPRVTLTSSVTGAFEMRVKVGAAWGDWTAYAVEVGALLPSGDGSKTVNVEYRDEAGNTLARSRSITLDATAPSGSIAINGGAATTASENVTVNDSVTGAADMRFSLDGGLVWSAWESYAATKALTLPYGDGTKAVEAEFRDAAGNVCGLRDTIALDGPGIVIHVSPDGDDVTGDGSVTKPYLTIGKGLAMAVAHDAVHVAAGTFEENITLKSGVVVEGAGAADTAILGTGTGSVVSAVDVDAFACIRGFTITGGVAYDGGGIYCLRSPITIRENRIVSNQTFKSDSNGGGGGIYAGSCNAVIVNNLIAGNSLGGTGVQSGGGVLCVNGAPLILGNRIESNTGHDGGGAGGVALEPSNASVIGNTFIGNAGNCGGALNAWNCSPLIAANLIKGNTAGYGGGAMYCDGAGAQVIGNTIVDNVCTAGGFPSVGGIDCRFTAATVRNCVLWGNGDDVFGASVQYCDVEDTDVTDTGVIHVDPRFVNAAGGDYRLRADSPCIDAGVDAPNVTADLDGVRSPQDGDLDAAALPDIGACERPYLAVEAGAATTSTIYVNLDAAFAGATEMRVDSGSGWSSWAPCAPLTALTLPSGNGVKTVSAEFRYAAGRVMTLQDTIELLNTNPAPITTDDYDGLWHRGPVTVHLTPHDQGCGVARTEYRIGATGAWLSGLQFTVAWRKHVWTGIRDVYYRSWDDLDRCEEAQVCHVKIDRRCPHTTDDADGLVHATDVTLHLTATDAHSGVGLTRYSIDGGVWQVGDEILIEALPGGVNDGVHAIRYYSVDNVGNVEVAIHSCSVTIDTTP